MTEATDPRPDGSDPATDAGELRLRDVFGWYLSQLRALIARVRRRSPNGTLPLTLGVAVALVAMTSPVAAQTKLGGIYCGTAVQTGINVLFTLLAGLGLPIAMFFTGRSGLQYMFAGGNPKMKNKAKESLIMSAVGFSLIIGAILLPGLITKIGNQFGFSFSSCVVPY